MENRDVAKFLPNLKAQVIPVVKTPAAEAGFCCHRTAAGSPTSNSVTTPVTVVINWTSKLKK
jgi:hypothetical protein